MRRYDGWRLRTDHITSFRYASPARASYNEVRKIPATSTMQTVLDGRVVTVPAAPQFTYWDYFGSQVVAFNVDGAHDRLIVQGTSLVETHPPAEVPECGWPEVEQGGERLVEYLGCGGYTAPNDEILETSRAMRAEAATPVAAAWSAVQFASGALSYVKGVTDVHSPAREAFEAGSGVCQDFAHLAITVMRSMGLPARYVSGYLHPDSDAEIGAAREAESHAWVEAWAGRWWALDPTTGSEVGLRHIVVARGRDYADVPPVKGIYAGPAAQDTAVTVTITRTA